MEIVCKPSTAEDDVFLQELFFAVRAPEFQMAGLSGPMLTQLLEMQYRAQYTSYMANYPAAINRILWVGGERVGRMLVDSSGGSYQLVDIALLPQHRGQGIGTQVLLEVCDEARAAKKAVQLSVRPDNPARRLYARLGFQETANDMVQISMELAPKGAAAGTPAEVMQAAEEPVLQGYTFEYFQTLQGKTLQAKLIRDDSELVPPPVGVVVMEVQKLGTPAADVSAGDSFRLELVAAGDPPFRGECIELTPPGAQPMAVFVSAVGPTNGGMAFEAIFNRSERLQEPFRTTSGR